MTNKIILEIKKFAKTIFENRSAIYELAKREFQAQNRSTYLGIIWGYIQPLTYIVLLILVFNVGLRTNPAGDVPFAIYLISGMIPWQFFTGTFISLTGVVKEYSFLVKKGNFSLSILHVAKILSFIIPHLLLMLVTTLVCWFYGILPNFYMLQFIYYLAAMSILLLGLGWISSATSIFVQDVVNVVLIVTQFGFWFTPIIWKVDNVPLKYQWIVKLNPMCYIITGYRDCFIYKVPFWENFMDTLYFWIFTLLMLMIGVMVFRKLKPHFGEVI